MSCNLGMPHPSYTIKFSILQKVSQQNAHFLLICKCFLPRNFPSIIVLFELGTLLHDVLSYLYVASAESATNSTDANAYHAATDDHTHNGRSSDSVCSTHYARWCSWGIPPTTTTAATTATSPSPTSGGGATNVGHALFYDGGTCYLYSCRPFDFLIW